MISLNHIRKTQRASPHIHRAQCGRNGILLPPLTCKALILLKGKYCFLCIPRVLQRSVPTKSFRTPSRPRTHLQTYSY